MVVTRADYSFPSNPNVESCLFLHQNHELSYANTTSFLLHLDQPVAQTYRHEHVHTHIIAPTPQPNLHDGRENQMAIMASSSTPTEVDLAEVYRRV